MKRNPIDRTGQTSSFAAEEESLILAEIQALRAARKRLQGWIRRLSEEEAAALAPSSPSRHRCRPA